MTTLAQLDKHASSWFNNQMRRRGFAVEKKFCFWRKRGPLFDVFFGRTLTGGELLRVHITIWSPWIDHPDDGQLGEFPPLEIAIGGCVSEYFPTIMSNGDGFLIASDEDVEGSLKEILQLIDDKALPWLAGINSYDSYAAMVDKRSCMGSRESKESLKLGIARGFEREPYPIRLYTSPLLS